LSPFGRFHICITKQIWKASYIKVRLLFLYAIRMPGDGFENTLTELFGWMALANGHVRFPKNILTKEVLGDVWKAGGLREWAAKHAAARLLCEHIGENAADAGKSADQARAVLADMYSPAPTDGDAVLIAGHIRLQMFAALGMCVNFLRERDAVVPDPEVFEEGGIVGLRFCEGDSSKINFASCTSLNRCSSRIWETAARLDRMHAACMRLAGAFPHMDEDALAPHHGTNDVLSVLSVRLGMEERGLKVVAYP
jgi:hypothetical protein